MKVLIADDETIIRVVLKRHLAKWGYEVVQAREGNEAWEALCGENPPKVAILDWMMPEIEGIEICQRLRERKELPFIYAILLTMRREKEDIIMALDSGAHDFLSKPVHTGELRSRIAVGARLVEAEEEIQLKNRKLSETVEQLNRTNKELERALKENKTLRGILPICANCKKIRLEKANPKKQNSWIVMEEYIRNRTEADFSHGICPECAQQLYPEFFKG